MSDTNRNSQADEGSLNWLAFRYVLDEMTEQELSGFEARLDADSDGFELAACDAVADAVLLGEIVTEAFEATALDVSVEESAAPLAAAVTPEVGGDEEWFSRNVSGHRAAFSRRFSTAASSAAVVAVAWMLTTSEPDSGTGLKSRTDVADRKPASSAVDESSIASEMVRFWADSENEISQRISEPQLLTAADVPDTLTADVPDWLLVAVRFQKNASDGLSEPEVLEN